MDSVVVERVRNGKPLSPLCAANRSGTRMVDYALNVAQIVAFDYHVTTDQGEDTNGKLYPVHRL